MQKTRSIHSMLILSYVFSTLLFCCTKKPSFIGFEQYEKNVTEKDTVYKFLLSQIKADSLLNNKLIICTNKERYINKKIYYNYITTFKFCFLMKQNLINSIKINNNGVEFILNNIKEDQNFSVQIIFSNYEMKELDNDKIRVKRLKNNQYLVAESNY